MEEKKDKKKVFIVVGIIFILLTSTFLYWNYFRIQELYLILADKHRVKIPQEIVNAKDCKKYRKWIESNFTPILVPNYGACPWDPKPKGKVGEFIINGIKLNIPRDYLLFNKNKPAGKVDDLSLLMQYPDMTPVHYSNDNEYRKTHLYNIRVSIDGVSSYQKCKQEEKLCNDPGLGTYLNRTNITRNQKNGKPNKIEKLFALPKDNLTAYKINGWRYFIRGNPLYPTYWLHCDPGEYELKGFNPGCETVFSYNDELYIDVYFSKHILLKDQIQVRKRIMQKISEFIDP